MELDSDQLNDEHDRLCKELASVQASLNRLRKQNGNLKKSIAEKSQDVVSQKQKIHNQESEIEKIGMQVRLLTTLNFIDSKLFFLSHD